MNHRTITAAAAIAIACWGSSALAQCGCNAVATTYAATTPAYTAYYVPVTTYYAPTSYVSYSWPTSTVTTYYSPWTTYSYPTVTYDSPVVQTYPVYYSPAACCYP